MPIYSDINSINPTIKPLLQDVDSVYQSLHNLFNTKFGERLFLPEFEFQLEDELFEIIDDVSAIAVFNKVLDAIQRWESRVKVDTSRTNVVAVPDENKYELDLFFQIVGLEGQTFNFQGSFTA